MSTRPSDRARLLALVGSSWRTQAIHAMVSLGLADLLAAGPMPIAALAAAAGADAEALSRLLRGLRLLGLVAPCAEGDRLTDLGRLLITGSDEDSLAHWVAWWAGVQWTTWGQLPRAVKEGGPMRERCLQAAGYALHAGREDVAAVFHRAMAQLSAAVAPVLVDRLAPLCAAGSVEIVDIGGGRGALLARLLRAFPQARGVLLEQDHALPAARAHLAQHEVLARCAIVQGDFFEHVPAGAAVYLLKSVLHNWDDPLASRLLTACRQAMGGEATLVVIERAMDDSRPDESDLRSDLNMLVSLGGRERSCGELGKLLGAAGLAVVETVPAGDHRLFICRAVGPAGAAPDGNRP